MHNVIWLQAVADGEAVGASGYQLCVNIYVSLSIYLSIYIYICIYIQTANTTLICRRWPRARLRPSARAVTSYVPSCSSASYIYVYIYLCIYIYIYIYIYMYIYMYVYIYICIYIYAKCQCYLVAGGCRWRS